MDKYKAIALKEAKVLKRAVVSTRLKKVGRKKTYI